MLHVGLCKCSNFMSIVPFSHIKYTVHACIVVLVLLVDIHSWIVHVTIHIHVHVLDSHDVVNMNDTLGKINFC